jgi:hypothetical protein
MVDIAHALRGISLTLTAAGPSAMMCVWFICMAALGIWGHGAQAQSAIGALEIGGAILIGVLATSGAFRP